MMGEGEGRLALLLFGFTTCVESNDEEEKKQRGGVGRYISYVLVEEEE